MNPGARNMAHAVARIAGRLWGVVPVGWRRKMIFALLVLESRTGAPRETLQRLFPIADDLDLVIDERATARRVGVSRDVVIW